MKLASVPPVRDLPEGRMLELPGRGETFVVDTGPREGPTLVLLHALACTGMLTWYPSFLALAEKARVVVLDQRWHGRGIRSPRFELDDCADDVTALADVLGVDRFVPVGYSMGSVVAQLVWQRHRDRVDGLVLCAATAHFQRAAREKMAMTTIDVGMGALRPRAGRVRAPSSTENDRLWVLREFTSTGYGAMGRAIAEIGKFDSTHWVGDIDVPTAVVVPSRDRIIPPRRQRWLARQITGAATYEIDGGHSACVMQAEPFTEGLAAATASVLARVRSPRV